MRLESLRLFAREWLPEDLRLLIDVDLDCGFKSFCYPPSYDLSTEEKRVRFIQTKCEVFEKYKICKLPIFLKSRNEFVGLMGIEPFTPKGSNVFELGYRLLEKHWNNGYAREFAPVLIEELFQSYPTAKLGALVHVKNDKSILLTESLGFQKVNSLEHNGESHWWLLYAHKK